MGSIYKALLLHNKTWCLSRGDMLVRFFDPRDGLAALPWNTVFTWKKDWLTLVIVLVCTVAQRMLFLHKVSALEQQLSQYCGSAVVSDLGLTCTELAELTSCWGPLKESSSRISQAAGNIRWLRSLDWGALMLAVDQGRLSVPGYRPPSPAVQPVCLQQQRVLLTSTLSHSISFPGRGPWERLIWLGLDPFLKSVAHRTTRSSHSCQGEHHMRSWTVEAILEFCFLILRYSNFHNWVLGDIYLKMNSCLFILILLLWLLSIFPCHHIVFFL